MAGKITYIAPVEKASGKIFGKKSRFVAVTRKTGQRLNGCAVTGVRTTPVTSSEKARRQKFGNVSTLTRERMQDPTRLPQDQQAFAAQSKYKTFYRFVWNMEWAAYEA